MLQNIWSYGHRITYSAYLIGDNIAERLRSFILGLDCLAQTLVFLLTSYMVLGKLFSFSVPQLSHLLHRDNKNTYLLSMRIKQDNKEAHRTNTQMFIIFHWQN